MGFEEKSAPQLANPNLRVLLLYVTTTQATYLSFPRPLRPCVQGVTSRNRWGSLCRMVWGNGIRGGSNVTVEPQCSESSGWLVEHGGWVVNQRA